MEMLYHARDIGSLATWVLLVGIAMFSAGTVVAVGALFGWRRGQRVAPLLYLGALAAAVLAVAVVVVFGYAQFASMSGIRGQVL